MQTLAAQIQSGEASRFHLIYGEEPYMARYYKKQLKTLLTNDGDDMNFSRFEGNTVPFDEVASLGSTLPFFAEKRVILMENTELFQSANDMTSILEGFPDTTFVIFVERRVDKRNRLYKWIQKNGCVTECAVQHEKNLLPWMAKYISGYGKTSKRHTMEYLLSKIGFQMDSIVNELDKLICYVGDRTAITDEDVDIICSGQAVGKIFDMIDAAAAGQTETVFRLYSDLLELREPPPRILHLLGRHMNILLQIKEIGGSLSGRDAAKKIGIPYFTVSKYQNQAKHFTRDRLLELLEARADYEERFKTGRLGEKLVAEIFLIKALTK